MLRRYHIDGVFKTICILLLSKLFSVSRRTDLSVTAYSLSKRKLVSSHLSRNHKPWRVPARFAQIDPDDGGGGRKSIPVDKTYDKNPPSYKKDIIIDEEGAMLSFFNSREEWLPLFRSVAGNNLPKDTVSLLNDITSTNTISTPTLITLNDIDQNTSFPWKRYDAIPTDENDRTVVARFLDSMQESLLAIPVMEETISQILSNDDDKDDNEDENDIQFVEEGRRLLAINRFHVLSSAIHNESNNDSSTIQAVDELFRHCWSEIFVLSQEGIVNSGSIILLPNKQEHYELSYIRRFLDMNIIQPLQWLGIHDDYEITSFQRDSPVIRMIYKLNDIPSTSSYTEEDGFAAN